MKNKKYSQAPITGFVSMGGNQPPIPLHIIINSALVCERTSNPHLSLLPIHCAETQCTVLSRELIAVLGLPFQPPFNS